MSIYLRGVELDVRGAVTDEPGGRHALVGRSRDLPLLLAHLERRPDCDALVVVGTGGPDVPAEVVARLGGRVLIAGPDRPAAIAAWLLPVPAIVLAAGAGTRMGGGKMLRRLSGRPLVGWAVEAARQGGADGVWVVYAEDAVRDALPPDTQAVYNPDAASGQASSLAAGLRALPHQAAAAVVLLGDQPLVGAPAVQALLNAWRERRRPPAVAASYGGGWLPPVVLGRELWPEALALKGDAGARAIFRRDPELVQAIPVTGRPEDADTPADLERIARMVERAAPNG